VAAELLKRGYKVLKPIGDRLPYDLAIDLKAELVRIQIKTAWRRKNVHIVDSRRTQTNRRIMKRSLYSTTDFDFAVLYVLETDEFYIMPVEVFCSYKSEITLKHKSCRASSFLNCWNLLG
jgi:hypothetical protein